MVTPNNLLIFLLLCVLSVESQPYVTLWSQFVTVPHFSVPFGNLTNYKGGQTLLAADDFYIPSGEKWTINRALLNAVQNGVDVPPYRIRFHESTISSIDDRYEVPGQLITEVNATVVVSGGSIRFNFDNVTLEGPGRYWISPIVSSSTPSGNGNYSTGFNWIWMVINTTQIGQPCTYMDTGVYSQYQGYYNKWMTSTVEPARSVSFRLRKFADFVFNLSGYNTTIPIKVTTGSTTRMTTQALTTQAMTTGDLTTKSVSTGDLTTAPLTTSPLTTSPLTTSPLTTSPLTTGSVYTGVTTGITTSEVSTGVTTGQISTGPVSTGVTTGTSEVSTGDISTALTTSEISTSQLDDDDISTGQITTNTNVTTENGITTEMESSPITTIIQFTSSPIEVSDCSCVMSSTFVILTILLFFMN